MLTVCDGAGVIVIGDEESLTTIVCEDVLSTTVKVLIS